MTTRRRKARQSARSVKNVTKPLAESNIKQIFNAVTASEEMVHFKYIMGRLWYLLLVLGMGFLIQWVWNAAMIQWCDGAHQVGLFEAAILWVCVY